MKQNILRSKIEDCVIAINSASPTLNSCAELTQGPLFERKVSRSTRIVAKDEALFHLATAIMEGDLLGVHRALRKGAAPLNPVGGFTKRARGRPWGILTMRSPLELAARHGGRIILSDLATHILPPERSHWRTLPSSERQFFARAFRDIVRSCRCGVNCPQSVHFFEEMYPHVLNYRG